jgi:acid phosphatase
MEYLSKLFSKWMPGNAKVAVNSHPRLSGIMDTINATDAHGPATKLPKEFYDPKAREIIDKISVEEWYTGYKESEEYRMLGIGGLMGDITTRMTGSVERNGNDGIVEVGGENGDLGHGRGGETNIKLALSGCHDTTLAAVLTSLGAFEGEKWPPFTSHIAIELFRKRQADLLTAPASTVKSGDAFTKPNGGKSQNWWSSIFGTAKAVQTEPESIARKPMEELTDKQKDAF